MRGRLLGWRVASLVVAGLSLLAFRSAAAATPTFDEAAPVAFFARAQSQEPAAPPEDASTPEATGPGTGSPPRAVPPPAADQPEGKDRVVIVPVENAERRERQGYVASLAVALLAGGGVAEFANVDVHRVAGFGAFWNVRGIIGTREWWGFEIAYVGSVQRLTEPGTSSRPNLLANGGEANLRLNVPVALGNVLLEPYAFGGVGVFRYTVSDREDPAFIDTADDTVHVPFGLGLAFAYRHLFVNTRFAYRVTFDEEIFRTTAVPNDLNTWHVGLEAGYEFR